jgi:iron complex transport system permease protein
VVARRSAVTLALFVVLAVLGIASATVGAAHLTQADFYGAFTGSASPGAFVVRDLRGPRIVGGMIVGAALGIGGTILQTALRNPLADPYLMGASGGAGLAVAIAIALDTSPALYGVVAFVGAMTASTISLLVASRASALSQQRLILTGVGIGSICAALTTLVILLAPREGTSLTVLSWLGGSLAGHGWADVRWGALDALVGVAIAVVVLPSLDAMRLGRERAAGVGVDVTRTSVLVVVASSLLAGAAVSLSGIIGFIGLLVPHAARAIVGGSVPWVATVSAALGGVIVIGADMIARGAAPPLELPVGILLSVLGVPGFLVLVVRSSRFA